MLSRINTIACVCAYTSILYIYSKYKCKIHVQDSQQSLNNHEWCGRWLFRIFVQVFLLEFLQIIRSSCFENGAGLLFRCCGSFSISSMNASAPSISSSSSLPVGSLKNWSMLSLKKSSSHVPAVFFARKIILFENPYLCNHVRGASHWPIRLVLHFFDTVLSKKCNTNLIGQ